MFCLVKMFAVTDSDPQASTLSKYRAMLYKHLKQQISSLRHKQLKSKGTESYCKYGSFIEIANIL